MKVADLIKQNKPPNILIGGPPGSGKTCLVAQSSGGYLMDFDGHVKNIITVKDKFKTLRSKREFDAFEDVVKRLNGKPSLVSSKYLEAKAKLISIAQL